MTDYGDSDVNSYLLCISKSISGGAPSGDKAAFGTTEKFGGSESFSQNIRHSAGNYHSSSKTGNYQIMIKLSGLWLIAYNGNTKTVSTNNVLGFLRSLQKLGEDPGYLWLRDDVDNDNLQIGFLNEIDTDYLRGFITQMDWEIINRQFVITSLTWEGVDH